MCGEDDKLTFGPVPSRRLGRSLGINNIPPKVCSYSCVYCQVGRTSRMSLERTFFFTTGRITEAVDERLTSLGRRGEPVDHLTFVPDGEPTLDLRLGEHVRALRGRGPAVAVITNGSLLWMEDVREDLAAADVVSVKVDALTPSLWKKVNRPHPSLDPDRLPEGVRSFSDSYGGRLLSETMLVRGYNDSPAELERIARFIGGLGVHRSYISVPTRPTSLDGLGAPAQDTLLEALTAFAAQGIDAEVLCGYEGDSFSSTGDPAQDILAITAVHPMKEEALGRLLSDRGTGWEVVEGLLASGALRELVHAGERFFVRSRPGR